MLTALAFLSSDLEEYDQGIKYWDKISEITPDDQWIPFRKSFTLFKQDKMEQSLQCLEKILIADEQENGPSKAQMMNQKGWYLFKMGKLEESMGWIKKSLAIKPKSENTLDSKAEILLAQEKYDEAGKIYEEIFEIKENDIVKRKIADCKRSRGNQIENDKELKEKYYHEAIKIYESILEKNKTNSSVWHSKGLCLWNLERYSDSRNCQLEAIKIDPKDKDYWNELGDIAVVTEKYDQAIVYFDKSIEISPNNYAFVEKGNILYDQKKQYEKAVSQYDQALKIEVTTDKLKMKADALYMTAREKTGNYSLDDALDCYVEVLKRDPENPGALGGKGNTLREMKKHDDAITSLNQSIKIDPEDYWTYKIKFYTYKEMKNYQDAINMENTMLEKFPDEEKHILNLMMDLYKNSGNEIKVKEYKEKIQKLEDLK
jgi:tetratricopeptide (TPR) repeat protein